MNDLTVKYEVCHRVFEVGLTKLEISKASDYIGATEDSVDDYVIESVDGLYHTRLIGMMEVIVELTKDDFEKAILKALKDFADDLEVEHKLQRIEDLQEDSNRMAQGIINVLR